MIGFLQEYGITVLGFTFTLKLFPCISHGYMETATTFTHLSMHSTNHCLVLYLSYTLSMTPSIGYSANITYKL